MRSVHPTALVVEGDALMSETVVRMLAHHGFIVTAAPDADAALQAVEDRSRPFDLVVTDRHLDDGDGAALRDALLEGCPTTRVLLVSGALDGAPPGAPPARAAFLAIPFDVNELMRAIRGLLPEVRLARRRTSAP